MTNPLPDGRKWVVLGIHGEDVKTVTDNVARVRMFIGPHMVDEDFALPVDFPPGAERTLELYAWLMRVAIDARVAQLEAQLAAGQSFNVKAGALVH